MNNTNLQIIPTFRGTRTSSSNSSRSRSGSISGTIKPPAHVLSSSYSLTGKSSSTTTNNSLDDNSTSTNNEYWPEIYEKEVVSVTAIRTSSRDKTHPGQNKKNREKKRAPPHLKSSVRNVVQDEILLASSEDSSNEKSDFVTAVRRRETTMKKEANLSKSEGRRPFREKTQIEERRQRTSTEKPHKVNVYSTKLKERSTVADEKDIKEDSREEPPLSPRTARRHALQQKKISWGENEFASSAARSSLKTKKSLDEQREGAEVKSDDFAKSMNMLQRQQINDSSKKQSSATPRALKSSIKTNSTWNIRGSRINPNADEELTSERMSNIAKHIRKDSRTRYRQQQQQQLQPSSLTSWSYLNGKKSGERADCQPGCTLSSAGSDDVWISSCQIQV